MPASTISLEHAKTDKLFYFVANVVIYRPADGRCLILKRDEREKVHPGKYAVPGGKLEWGDLDLAHPTRMNGDVLDFEHALEDLLVREAREEAGVTIRGPFTYINSVAFVRPDGIPVILMKMAGLYVEGDIVLERGAFTNFAWVNVKEVRQYDCIEGIREEVAKAIAMYQKNS